MQFVLIFFMIIFSFTLGEGIFVINLFAQSEGDNLPEENFIDGFIFVLIDQMVAYKYVKILLTFNFEI